MVDVRSMRASSEPAQKKAMTVLRNRRSLYTCNDGLQSAISKWRAIRSHRGGNCCSHPIEVRKTPILTFVLPALRCEWISRLPYKRWQMPSLSRVFNIYIGPCFTDYASPLGWTVCNFCLSVSCYLLFFDLFGQKVLLSWSFLNFLHAGHRL